SWNTYTVSNDESTRTGLLGAPVYVFTIGVGTSPQAYDPASDGYMDPQLRVSDTTGAPTGLDPNAFVYNFTTEYDLKQIAESSGGIYKYAPTSEQLYGIYMEISQLISSLALSQAKSGRGDGNSDNSRGSALDDSMATTETFSLVGYSEATLSFYQKYYMKHGANGIVVQVGINQSGTWKYKYVIPKQLYTGNIWLDAPSSRIKDDFNVEMRWAYNGISGSGKFTWDYVEVDLTPFVGYSEVRVRFRYLNVTSAYGGYWYIDDLKVRATRSDYLPTYLSADQWEYKTADAISGPAHSGTKMWWCHNTSVGSTTDAFRKGIDNSLYSRPIDLTNARNATFEAYFKFNINYSVGRPPDCLRVEVSNDNGLTWRTLTLGVRAAWNVSGTEAAGADGKSYTGLDEGNNWVSSNTLSRLTTDLTGWAGSVIKLRIRVISATDHANYQSSSGNVFGVYVDDVCVYGTSLEGAGRGERAIDNSENEEYVQFNTNMNSTSENIDKPKEEQKKIVSYSTIENEKKESEGIVVLFDNIEYIMRYEEEFVGRDEL
ncbi:MAG: hypothetical protein QXT63_06440, partial [Thermoplasmata archaeon]